MLMIFIFNTKHSNRWNLSNVIDVFEMFLFDTLTNNTKQKEDRKITLEFCCFLLSLLSTLKMDF